jgi:hypothetical protein
MRRGHRALQLVGGRIGELHDRLGNGRQGHRRHVGMLPTARTAPSCRPAGEWLMFLL